MQTKEDKKTYMRQYREKNKESIKIQRKKHYIESANKRKIYEKEYRVKNKERLAVAIKKWKQENKNKTSIGLAGEDSERLRKLADYIDRHKENQ